MLPSDREVGARATFRLAVLDEQFEGIKGQDRTRHRQVNADHCAANFLVGRANDTNQIFGVGVSDTNQYRH